MKISCNGLVRSGTGIGVDQRYLYPLLRESGHDLDLLPNRDRGRSPWQVALGLFLGFLPPIHRSDVFLSIVPPYPFWVRSPSVTIVHDLRWLRTRTRWGRAYRAWDLRRTAAKSQVLACISQRTKEDLVEFIPSAADKIVVVELGPGLADKNTFTSGAAGSVLLIGGAAHKRNELAAQLLAEIKPPWCHRIVGVGLSEQARSTIEASYGSAACDWHERPSDEALASIYESAEIFVFLGVEEGFGLPYVEALVSGCKVIAIDQPLTREVLGAAGVLLKDGTVSELAGQMSEVKFPEDQVRREQASRFSWGKFADGIENALIAAAGTRP